MKGQRIVVDIENSFNILRIGFNNAFTSQEGLIKAADLHKLQTGVV